MKDIECPDCGEMIPDDSRYCDQCGVELLECVNCGTLGTGAFCPECGKPMLARKNNTDAVKKNKDDDGHKTGGGRQNKTIALKARKGGFTIVPENEAIIGRKGSPYENNLSACDLISRRHGKFVKQGRDWYIVDFGSTNGTLVNNVELAPDTPVKFSVGDVVDIGTYLFDVVEV